MKTCAAFVNKIYNHLVLYKSLTNLSTISSCQCLKCFVKEKFILVLQGHSSPAPCSLFLGRDGVMMLMIIPAGIELVNRRQSDNEVRGLGHYHTECSSPGWRLGWLDLGVGECSLSHSWGKGISCSLCSRKRSSGISHLYELLPFQMSNYI